MICEKTAEIAPEPTALAAGDEWAREQSLEWAAELSLRPDASAFGSLAIQFINRIEFTIWETRLLSGSCCQDLGRAIELCLRMFQQFGKCLFGGGTFVGFVLRQGEFVLVATAYPIGIGAKPVQLKNFDRPIDPDGAETAKLADNEFFG